MDDDLGPGRERKGQYQATNCGENVLFHQVMLLARDLLRTRLKSRAHKFQDAPASSQGCRLHIGIIRLASKVVYAESCL